MNNLDALIDVAKTVVKQDIVIAPWLTWGDGQNRIPSHLQTEMQATATRLANQYWSPEWRLNHTNNYPIPKDQAWAAIYETLCGTAVYLSHLELGQLDVTEEMVSVSERLMTNFLSLVEPIDYVKFYLLTAIYENLHALEFYGSMQADEFVQGHLHRPWGTETLRQELDAAISLGTVERNPETDTLRLTPAGKDALRVIEQIFSESRYLKFRSQLIQLNNFNKVEDISSIMETLFPNSHLYRSMLVDQSGIQLGMHVLELGCGNGALTFEAGLYKKVGPHGRLVATDPSTSLLAAVRRKCEAHQAHWVEVVQTKAERLPFPDNTFDTVIGCAFLHLTNIEETVREIARVLKPGGTFVTLYPLHFPAQNPFFVEWFAPLLTQRGPSKSQDTLPGPDTVPAAMKPFYQIQELRDLSDEVHYTSPRTVVKFFVEIANLFDEQMSELPWRARQEMIQHLMERGDEVCRKYPADQLVEQHPLQFIRAVVVK
ncbi:hypothetical protein GCM10025857_13030 [Alicyclobacillus contaminans]|uniref:class I SAM-dependent methyltransferase n=1 Tax=Alicyclobacillus contaminans TaxID=392016 RepID=UPI00041DE36F|nr:methyltransferase domain-containing protein [Alicyclobacillus contaminans]GMA49946.1 hypothetical protein GCM10025857_13030 [Alicyclobacillus contaminans]